MEVIFFCRSFDVQNTGRITESLFIQILKTKFVPEEDVKEMIEGYTSYFQKSFSKILLEYKKLDFVKPDDENNNNEEDQSEGEELKEYIYYHGESFDLQLRGRGLLSYLIIHFSEFIKMLTQ